MVHHILDLNNELLEAIFEHLQRADLNNCRLVCSVFKELIDAQVTSLAVTTSNLAECIQRTGWYEQWPALKKLGLYKLPSALCKALFRSLENSTFVCDELTVRFGELASVCARQIGAPGSPWANLKVLRLQNCRLTQVHLKLLADSPESSWRLLRELDLHSNGLLGDLSRPRYSTFEDAARFLSKCPHLKVLKLPWCGLVWHNLEVIMKVQLPLLEEFVATGNYLDGDAETLVQNASSWPSLKILRLDESFVGKAIIELTEAEFPNLEGLSLPECSQKLDEECLLALRDAMQTRWLKLKLLDVSGNNTTLEAKNAFVRGNDALARLEHIDFLTHGAEVQLLSTLAEEAGRFQNLRALNCTVTRWDNEFTEDQYGSALGAFLLAREWDKLESLSISVLPDALAEAAQTVRFPALESLILGRSDFEYTEQQIQTLFSNPWSTVKSFKAEVLEPEIYRTISYLAQFAPGGLPNVCSLEIAVFVLSRPAVNAVLNAQWPESLKEVRLSYSVLSIGILDNIEGQWRLVSNNLGEFPYTAVFNRI